MNKIPLHKLSKNISSGLTPLRSNEEFWNSPDIPWVKTEQLGKKNIFDTNEKVSKKALVETGLKLYPVNTLSVAMYGEGKTRGSVSILKDEMTTNQACCNIELDPEKAYYEYVYYNLKTQYHQLRNLSSGVRKNLNSNDIKNFEISIPKKVSEQQKIASVLSSLDSKIELNNRINAELETMAKTLYDYWFVQFDFPNEQGKPYKSSGAKMVYNNELKREIPEGWKVELISDCCSIVDCLHSKKPGFNFESEESYLLQLENIRNDGLIDLSKKYYVAKTDYEEWTSRIEIRDHDIVITNAGRVASTAQIPQNLIAGIGRNITAIRPLSISPTYLFRAFQGEDIRRQVLWNTDTGSFFKSLNVKGIKMLYVLRPPQFIEDKFESFVLPMRRRRELIQEENQQLASLRDWLLPMLMNGQVTVKEAEEKAYINQVERMHIAAEPGSK